MGGRGGYRQAGELPVLRRTAEISGAELRGSFAARPRTQSTQGATRQRMKRWRRPGARSSPPKIMRLQGFDTETRPESEYVRRSLMGVCVGVYVGACNRFGAAIKVLTSADWHAVHNLSSRCGQPFIRLNSAAIPARAVRTRAFWPREDAFTGVAQKDWPFRGNERPIATCVLTKFWRRDEVTQCSVPTSRRS